MKKIVCLIAAVAMAVCTQAAVAVTWQTGTGVKDASGNAFATTTTGYTAAIAFFTDAAGAQSFAPGGTTSSESYKTKGSAGFAGMTDAKFDPGTYYSQITITETATGKTYTSDMASFTVAAGSTANPTINFTTGANLGGSPKLGEIKYVGGSDPTPDTPEPTSGLLLLVGGAVLALRRKQK